MSKTKILLATDGIFHPPFFARQALHQTLAKINNLTFRHIRSLEKLPGDLKDYRAIVIYVHHKEISDEALSTLDKYVSDGGGIFGIHTATASFKQQMDYFEILGGRFIGHGEVEPFEIKPVAGSEVFSDIPSFTVKDELYLHELQPGITPHFTAMYDDGQEVPIVWTYLYGNGRVCYAGPGHRTATIRNETYQRILQRGLMWVCGR